MQSRSTTSYCEDNGLVLMVYPKDVMCVKEMPLFIIILFPQTQLYQILSRFPDA